MPVSDAKRASQNKQQQLCYAAKRGNIYQRKFLHNYKQKQSQNLNDRGYHRRHGSLFVLMS